MRPSWLVAVGLAGTAGACAAPPRPASRSGDGLPATAAVWVVDPKTPGPMLPPAGRSLFDFVVVREEDGRRAYDVPYPFEALVRRIEGYLSRSADGPPLEMVLIPRGRSLQRDAARPDFFRFPRAVVAAGGEPSVAPGHSGVLLKDRLYLGYQEKANLIEVISYNEAAGRFEFQIVRDYREGGAPRVVYANRALCVSCHQNAGPIFPRPLWDETNANAGIAASLAAERRGFYGFPLEPGVDVPYLIDNATDRANLFAAWQILWREGCGGNDAEAIRCRADLLTFALQYRLSGGQGFDTRSAAYRERFLPALGRRTRARWPGGWRVPSADLPNRNPMLAIHARPASVDARGGPSTPEMMHRAAHLQLEELVRQSDVPSQFEPLLPRGPLAVWAPPGHDEPGLRRAVAGLSEFLADADVRRLDTHLARLGPGPGAPRRTWAAVCTFEERTREQPRVSFACDGSKAPPAGARGVFALAGRIYLDGIRVQRGSIDRVEVDGEEMPELEVTGGALKSAGSEVEAVLTVRQAVLRLHARRATGEAVEAVVLAWKRGESGVGRALLRTVDDFGRVRTAIDAIARRTSAREMDGLADKPFRRASILKALEAELGMPPRAWCCEDTTGLPPPAPDAHPRDEAGSPTSVDPPPRYQVFVRYCGHCHENADRFPPNFLHGTPAEVEANLTQCAERIYFRLGMWGKEPPTRPKTPMPPENALQDLSVSRDEWPTHADLHTLREYAGDILRSQSRSAPSLDTLQARGYGTLRPCLPDPRIATGARSPSGTIP